MNVLEIKDVKKKLSKRDIIKGISFSVKEGQIFGFLGPNGAGKTTTIRMITGLIAPDSGSILICGHDIKTDKVRALKNVGAVVENSELYTYLSGWENIMQCARIRKIPIERTKEVVKLVGLEGRIKDKVKKYSLGMKQRLGLGIALLSNPKLLVLDEPTNGLDPTGIMEFRSILKRIAKEEGTSVFVSSHILSEVQKLCDEVAFINDGVIQSVESINGEGRKTEEEYILLSVHEVEKCIELLKNIKYVKNIKKENTNISVKIEKGHVPEMIFNLCKEGIHIEEIYKNKQVLEERYVEIVEGGGKK